MVPPQPYISSYHWQLRIHLIPRYKGDVKNPKGGVRGVIPRKQNYSEEKSEKKYSLEEKRQKNSQAYYPWTEEDDAYLTTLYKKNTDIKVMMGEFGRSESAIISRLKKLGLIETDEESTNWNLYPKSEHPNIW